MKLSLRNLALGATLVVAGAAMAQDAPTVTLNWQTKHGLGAGDHRGGTGVNGVVYTSAGTAVKAIDANGVRDFFTTSATVNKGMVSDDAGNLLIFYGWPTGAGTLTNENNAVIIKADGSESVDVTIKAPTEAPGWGNRSDMQGRAIGDFFSEEGAVFFLTGNTLKYPIPVVIANGEFVESEYATDNQDMAAANTMASAIPAVETMEDYNNASDPYNMFYYRTGSAHTNIYTMQNGELETLKAPTELPNGWTLRSQNGFEVFLLNDALYQVRMADDHNWGSNFVICDEEGNVIFATNYGEEYNSDSTGNGCGVYAHKVSDTKVELYQFYNTGTAGKGFAAMYTIEIPNEAPEYPTLYMVGEFQGWDPANATELVAEDGKYTFSFPEKAEKGFKISTVKGGWTEFDGGVLGASDVSCTLTVGEAVQLEAGKLGNMAAPKAGEWTITIDAETMQLTLTGEATEVPVTLPQAIFLRGDMNDWNAEWSYYFMPVMAEDGENQLVTGNGEYVYSLYLDALMGNFKLGGQDWNDFDYGAQGEDPVVTADCTKQAWNGSIENWLLNDLVLTDVTLTFYYQPDASKCSWLQVKGTEYVEPAPTTDKGHFAYNLKAEPGENSVYTISFKSTGDAAKAVLVLTDQDGNDTEAELGEVKKGDNTFTYDASALEADKQHNWAVRIHNYEVTETKISEPIAVGGGRAGLAVMVDPEYPEVFGKVVIGRTANGGLDIYDAEGDLEASELFKGQLVTPGAGSANTSSPMDGKQRGNEVLLASWGDDALGVVAVDLTDLNQAPYSVFEGVKEANGKIMNGDIATGSGTPCVALYGEGDATDMYVFDEDVFGNHLCVSHIGANKTVGTALEKIGFGGTLANHNVSIWPVEGHGLFLGQIRGVGNCMGGAPGLSFYDPEEMDITWSCADMAEEDENWLATSASGVCVNPAGDLLAVATYTSIEVMLLSWDGNKPVLEKYLTIESPYASGQRTNVQFDAANNIHVTNQANGYYTITLAEKEPIALSAAHSQSFIANASGVENITVEAAAAAEAVYYNLNGVKVDSKNLVPGVYVKVAGEKASKVVVK